MEVNMPLRGSDIETRKVQKFQETFDIESLRQCVNRTGEAVEKIYFERLPKIISRLDETLQVTSNLTELTPVSGEGPGYNYVGNFPQQSRWRGNKRWRRYSETPRICQKIKTQSVLLRSLYQRIRHRSINLQTDAIQSLTKGVVTGAGQSAQKQEIGRRFGVSLAGGAVAAEWQGMETVRDW